jgi:hypothetical protein
MDDHINSDYETDALIWTNTQIALLRAGKFDQLDLDNIISELEYQVRKDKRYVGHGYVKALKDAARETHLPPSAFPKDNPFTTQQILDEDYWPGEKEKAAGT